MSKNIKRKQKKSKLRTPMLANRPMGNPASYVLPNETDVWLNFFEETRPSLVAATAISIRYNPNAPYDVDPVLGSTSTAGFSALATVFQFARAIRYRYVIQVANAYTAPVNVIIVNSNLDPGTTGLTGFVGNQYTQQHLLGATGSPPHTFRGDFTVAQIAGSRSPETDDNFASTTASTPSDKIWLAIGFDTLGITTSTSYFCTIQCQMLIRFYERKNLSS